MDEQNNQASQNQPELEEAKPEQSVQVQSVQHPVQHQAKQPSVVPPQPQKPSKIRNFVSNASRVLRLTRKPARDEFLLVAKITAFGIVVIGVIGYVVESMRWAFV